VIFPWQIGVFTYSRAALISLSILSMKKSARSLAVIALLTGLLSGCGSYLATRYPNNDPKATSDNDRMILNKATYKLGFVEFDEQGETCNRKFAAQLITDVSDESLKALQNGGHLLLITYVHGWENNAHSDDVNRFEDFLGNISQSKMVKRNHFEVYGVYLAWNGRGVPEMPDNAFGALLENSVMVVPKIFSFWTREAAAGRVANVSGTEALLWLDKAAKAHDPTGAKTIVIGHSFGALIVDSALAQATQSRMLEPQNTKTPINPPADLVVLLNQASNAMVPKRMQQVFKTVAWQNSAVVSADHPFVVSITSNNDDATRLALPAGRFVESIFSIDHRYADKYDLLVSNPGYTQHTFTENSAGHLDALVTHRIIHSDTPIKDDPDGDLGFASVSSTPDRTYWRLHRTGVFPKSPYWIVQCDGDFINGHLDVWNPKVLGFIIKLMEHNEYSTLSPGHRTTIVSSAVSDLNRTTTGH
jgi:hypothetical protein